MMLGYDKSPAWLNDSLRRGMPIGSLEAERIAHHETGHVLLARVQHLPVHWVLGNIGFDEFGDGGRGHCCSVSPIKIAKDANDPEIKLGALGVEMLTYCGGRAAERKHMGASADYLGGAYGDYKKIVKLALDALGPLPSHERCEEAVRDIGAVAYVPFRRPPRPRGRRPRKEELRPCLPKPYRPRPGQCCVVPATPSQAVSPQKRSRRP
jgi:hypothetical protein